MATIIHADDYGITLDQAQSILALSDRCGGRGALSSVSMFANSPVFEQAAELARPFVERGSLAAGVHLNLVEGRPCSNPRDVPLLVNGRGTFAYSFTGLLSLSLSSSADRNGLREQIARELTAQIERYLAAFPDQRAHLRIDSHQHTHLVPLVLDGLLAAIRRTDSTVTRFRIPVETVAPHLVGLHRLGAVKPINLVKDALLATLAVSARRRLPEGCTVPDFCGIVLSGRMNRVSPDLIATLAARADRRGRDLELLFHPISVPRAQCLDPENAPFAGACASAGRDAEAEAIRTLQLP